MDWKIFWLQLDPVGRIVYGLTVVAGILAVCFAIYLAVQALRHDSRQKAINSRNYPNRVFIHVEGLGKPITLERIWLNGEWRYILRGQLPDHLAPVSQDKERLARATPGAI